MTASAEPVSPPLGAAWRAAVERAQEEALPDGRVVVSCAALPGLAGLGRHVKEILDTLARHGQPSVCISPPAGGHVAASPSRGLRLPRRAVARGRRPSTGRARQAWAEFDAYAAGQLPGGGHTEGDRPGSGHTGSDRPGSGHTGSDRPGSGHTGSDRPGSDHLMAFCGQALTQFGVARQLRYKTIALVSGGVHERRLARQHAAAHSLYPLERSNAGRVSERHLLEYAQAERIYVASRYIWESFVEEGIPDSVLSRFPLTPDPRFAPDGAPRRTPTFNIVYVGGLSVAKGVPLLVDAVRRLPHEDIRLVLVGGWKSRGMRRFVEQACAEDRRIEAAPGDPLPHLRAARLCVHPSYVDGFSYGAAEALACGVPVIASEDTGMKELIEPGRTGLVVPTGDPAALTEAIEAAFRGEILGG